MTRHRHTAHGPVIWNALDRQTHRAGGGAGEGTSLSLGVVGMFWNGIVLVAVLLCEDNKTSKLYTLK